MFPRSRCKESKTNVRYNRQIWGFPGLHALSILPRRQIGQLVCIAFSIHLCLSFKYNEYQHPRTWRDHHIFRVLHIKERLSLNPELIEAHMIKRVYCSINGAMFHQKSLLHMLQWNMFSIPPFLYSQNIIEIVDM